MRTNSEVINCYVNHLNTLAVTSIYLVLHPSTVIYANICLKDRIYILRDVDEEHLFMTSVLLQFKIYSPLEPRTETNSQHHTIKVKQLTHLFTKIINLIQMKCVFTGEINGSFQN